jgi:hypothetical protein
MLWHVGRHHLLSHTLLDEVLHELDGGELPTVVHPEHLHLVPGLQLRHELELLDGVHSLILGAQSA